MPPPPAFREDFDWADVMLSRFSIASSTATDDPARPDPHHRPAHEPRRHYAGSSDADDDASLAARSSDAGDARSASTFSAAPSGAASACASPPGAAGGGPVRKPSSRHLRVAPMSGGKGKGKAKAVDAEGEAAQGLDASRQALAQMQLLLDEFEYLGAAVL
jgi:hypothetical protein